MAVLYGQDIEQGGNANSEVFIKKGTQARLDALQAELISAKDADRKKQIKDEILAIKREFNRSKQFGIVMEKKPAEGKNNLDSVSAADLMRLDKEVSKERRGEFLSKSFLYKRTADSEGNVMEEPVEAGKITPGDTLFVDFGKNKSAESKIGAGDFLPIDLKVIKITDINGNVRTGKRSIQSNKVGYYDEQGYIPIYNGYVVELPKKTESEDYIRKSNPSIILSDNTNDENKAKDEFIEIASRYEQFGEGFSPWNIIEKQRFQAKATELAKKVETDYGIPWQVTYGQATLETGYGRSAPNNNYFGIKGSGGTYRTKEVIDGKETEITASFRGYSSMEESFDAYGKFLTTNPIYQQAFSYKDNPEQFLYAIWKGGRGGYATDPEYVTKIKSIWGNYDKIKDFKIDASEITGRTTPDALINQAQRYLGTEYNWGGNSEYGIDCSHLVCKSLSDLGATTKSFYRVALDLRNITPVKPLNAIQKGDLIFWHGGARGVSHVAIATSSPIDGTVNIIDASGKKSGAGKVAERNIPLSSKLSAGTPPFYS